MLMMFAVIVRAVIVSVFAVLFNDRLCDDVFYFEFLSVIKL